MMKIFEIGMALFLIIISCLGYGYAYSVIYEFGVRDMLYPIYELPSIPKYSFIMFMLIWLTFSSLYGKKKETYKATESKPYSLLLGRLITLYAYVVIILLFNYIYHI